MVEIVNAIAAVSPLLLQALIKAMTTADKADDKVKAAFIKAGADQSEVIKTYYATRIMLSSAKNGGPAYTYEQALMICDKRRLTKTAKPGDDLMTAEEHGYFNAATVHLVAARKRWGIATTSSQGAHNRAPRTPDTVSVGQKAAATRRENQTKALAAIKVETVQDMGVFLITALKHCEAFAMKADKSDKLVNEYLGVIKDALAEITKIHNA